MTAYYNEHDPYAAQWLRNLIAAGHIAPGDVDERSIEDVRPDELAGYTQCHFFAGIGVWSLALRQAGWPDDRPVWTGSCPCQPFSAAGQGKGIIDERHLWPAFHWLIQQRRPSVVFGEQVASKDGLAWLDIVQTDMENTGYACGATDLCAAGVGSPNIRQRLYFVAERMGNATIKGLQKQQDFPGTPQETPGSNSREIPKRTNEPVDRVADSNSTSGRENTGSTPENEGTDGRKGRNQRKQEGDHGHPSYGKIHVSGPTNGFWRAIDWLGCRDGKWRPVEPGTFPLAHGITNRVGRLRAYGNAINAEAATEFIKAYINNKEENKAQVA